MASSSSCSSWACSRCTFLNSPSRKSSCQICLFPFPSSSSSSSSSSTVTADVSRWSCRACTFSNPSAAASCEVCYTPAALPSRSSAAAAASSRVSLLVDLEPEPHELGDPAIGRVFLPLSRCGTKRPLSPGPRSESELPIASPHKKLPRVVTDQQQHTNLKLPSPDLENADGNQKKCTIKILSHNVWFREDLELCRRMEALGDLIELNTPDFICLQEVTPDIYQIFQKSSWWKQYKCSLPQHMAAARPYFCMQMSKLPAKRFSRLPFTNSVMGRELCMAEIDVGESQNLLVATSHLESPCPAPPRWDQMYSKERVVQAKEAINILKDSPNAIFAGDMNWDDKLDGPFPLPDGWVDAWLELRPGENGWTYDTKANQMLSGNRTLQKRLDRFMCKFDDFKINSIEMIGMEPIPGLSFIKEKKTKKELKKLVLPVLPSDHYGLLLTISRL